jgi:hypothetical protein
MGEGVGLSEGVGSGGKGVTAPAQAESISAVNAREIETRVARSGDAKGLLEATEPTSNDPAE